MLPLGKIEQCEALKNLVEMLKDITKECIDEINYFPKYKVYQVVPHHVGNMYLYESELTSEPKQSLKGEDCISIPTCYEYPCYAGCGCECRVDLELDEAENESKEEHVHCQLDDAKYWLSDMQEPSRHGVSSLTLEKYKSIVEKYGKE